MSHIPSFEPYTAEFNLHRVKEKRPYVTQHFWSNVTWIISLISQLFTSTACQYRQQAYTTLQRKMYLNHPMFPVEHHTDCVQKPLFIV